MNFLLAVEIAAALEDGERRKRRKPRESTMASTILMGLVLRKDLEKAILLGARRRVLQAGQGAEKFRFITRRGSQTRANEGWLGLHG